jgi:hypothetical protein
MPSNKKPKSTREPCYCPCCGYRRAEQNPFAELHSSWHGDLDGLTVEDRFDNCSRDGCHCCGYEFGCDQNVGACGQAISLGDYRKFWIKDGCQWFHGDDPRPKNWNLAAQLAAARIPFDD